MIKVFLKIKNENKKIFNFSVHSTGFNYRFKEPINFNGLLSYYTVKVLTYYGSTFDYLQSKEIVLDKIKKCKNSSESDFIDLPIGGLLPFRTYKITVSATNSIGLTSLDSDEVIINTFESSPRGLLSLVTKPVLNLEENTGFGIVFKFNDPIYLNGILTRFNLYLYIGSFDKTLFEDIAVFYDYQLQLIYSGLLREFHYKNLKPYKSYYFLYEICTASGCTRQTKLTMVLTLEGEPFNQPEPIVTKLPSNLRCFNISISEPMMANGIILYYEVYRTEKVHPLNAFKKDILIKNITAERDVSKYSFRDCNLKPNVIYSYKVISYNIKGSAESNYSRPIFSNQLLPEEFSKINVTQISDSLIKIGWKRPKATNGQIVSYNIFRNTELITNSTFISNFSSAIELTYDDNFDFLPKTEYVYEIFACNEAGCSTDKTNFTAKILTKDQPPYRVEKLLLLQLKPRSAKVTARNSVFLKSKTQNIVQYSFFLNNSLVYQGANTEAILDNLIPYTVYSVTLVACTFLNASLGCTRSSSDLMIITKQAPPEGLSSIEFVDYQFDDYFVNVKLKWKPPRYSYGYLNLIELKRDGIEIFISKNLSISTFTDMKLDYGKNYTYQLFYFNDVGSVNVTTWHCTIQNFPKLVDKPQCATKTSKEISLSFSDPSNF